MDKIKCIEHIYAIINTIGATTVRADQVDVVTRLNACTNELRNVAQALEAQIVQETEEKNQPEKG